MEELHSQYCLYQKLSSLAGSDARLREQYLAKMARLYEQAAEVQATAPKDTAYQIDLHARFSNDRALKLLAAKLFAQLGLARSSWDAPRGRCPLAAMKGGTTLGAVA